MSQNRRLCPPASSALAPRPAPALTPSIVRVASQSLPARWLVPVAPGSWHPALSRPRCAGTRDISDSRVLLAPACRSSSSAHASGSIAAARLPPVSALAQGTGSWDDAFLVLRIPPLPMLRLPAVGPLLSSTVPTNLRYLSSTPCAQTRLLMPQFDHAVSFNFFRRSSNVKSYTST